MSTIPVFTVTRPSPVSLYRRRVIDGCPKELCGKSEPTVV
jgi:hypothetical protein